MARIKVRLIGDSEGVQAFADFLNKTAGYISALSIIQQGTNQPSRKSTTDVLRYMEVDFDSSAMNGKS